MPARGDRRFDAYTPGLHHLCMQVALRSDVDEIAATLGDIGVETSAPQEYPEYAGDYYATFFEDPDGIRFEIVARRGDRDYIVERWEELEGFVNPVRRLREKLASRKK